MGAAPLESARSEGSLSDAGLAVLRLDAEGSAGRRRDRQPPADAARRAHPPPRRRHLHLAAARPPRRAQGRGDPPRGDEPRRRDRGFHAGDPAGRAVAGVRSLGQVRPGAAAAQGPAPARLLRRPDPRGGDHRHRAAGAPELPPAPGALLSDPDQVPRRDPAAVRRHARPRVHDEGRLFLPRRLRRSRARVPEHARHLFAHLHPARSAVPRGGRRPRVDRGQRLARVPRAGRIRRGCDRLLPAVRLRGERRARGGGRAARAAPGPGRADGEGADAGQDALRGRRGAPRPPARADREGNRGHARRDVQPAARPRRSRSERDQGAEASRPRPLPFRDRRRDRAPSGLQGGLHRAGRDRSRHPRHRRSHGRGHGGLRLRRERRRATTSPA